jgi:hypothetical protein
MAGLPSDFRSSRFKSPPLTPTVLPASWYLFVPVSWRVSVAVPRRVGRYSLPCWSRHPDRDCVVPPIRRCDRWMEMGLTLQFVTGSLWKYRSSVCLKALRPRLARARGGLVVTAKALTSPRFADRVDPERTVARGRVGKARRRPVGRETAGRAWCFGDAGRSARRRGGCDRSVPRCLVPMPQPRPAHLPGESPA